MMLSFVSVVQVLGGHQKAVEGSLQHVVNEVRHLKCYEMLPESNTQACLFEVSNHIIIIIIYLLY